MFSVDGFARSNVRLTVHPNVCRSVFKVFLIWGRASLVKQQDQYLMSWPANHKSSSGREAFSGARWCSAVECSVYPEAQRSGRCPWQQWMEVLDSGPALLPPSQSFGKLKHTFISFCPTSLPYYLARKGQVYKLQTWAFFLYYTPLSYGWAMFIFLMIFLQVF